jgi:hypothetical protein
MSIINLNSGNNNTFSYENNSYLINNVSINNFPISLVNLNNQLAVLTFINVIPITDVNLYFIILSNTITINSIDMSEHNVLITNVSNYRGLV